MNYQKIGINLWWSYELVKKKWKILNSIKDMLTNKQDTTNTLFMIKVLSHICYENIGFWMWNNCKVVLLLLLAVYLCIGFIELPSRSFLEWQQHVGTENQYIFGELTFWGIGINYLNPQDIQSQKVCLTFANKQ